MAPRHFLLTAPIRTTTPAEYEAADSNPSQSNNLPQSVFQHQCLSALERLYLQRLKPSA